MKRKIGKSDIQVSAIGMGCWGIGGTTYAPIATGGSKFGWGDVDDKESIRAIHAALDSGIDFFDTADVYGGGHSEKILGEALSEKTNQAVIATKFGHSFDPYTRQMLGPDTSPQYIRRACEGSLQRLRKDCIDLYQFHIGEFPPAHLDDICDVLERLVDEGKIRTYGWVTGDNYEGAKVFAKRKNCSSIQFRLNVLEDSPDILSLCENSNLASICLAPLAMSLLTGKFNNETTFSEGDVRHGWNLNSGIQAERLKQVEQLREVLTVGGRSIVQGALGWLWARSKTTIPIPGCKTVKQVEENAGAMQYGPLSEIQMKQISEILGR